MASILLPKKEKKRGSGHGAHYDARTVLFNDEIHTFDDVARQLVKAIRCTYAHGMALANMVHNVGHAVVYRGALERCEAVAMVLEEIKLRVTVES
jgi:ATP-dependent Clp protease adapter protein ClpS